MCVWASTVVMPSAQQPAHGSASTDLSWLAYVVDFQAERGSHEVPARQRRAIRAAGGRAAAGAPPYRSPLQLFSLTTHGLPSLFPTVCHDRQFAAPDVIEFALDLVDRPRTKRTRERSAPLILRASLMLRWPASRAWSPRRGRPR